MSKDKTTIPYPDITSTFSATETTGLIRSIPENDSEYESYQELAGMEVPKKKKRK